MAIAPLIAALLFAAAAPVQAASKTSAAGAVQAAPRAAARPSVCDRLLHGTPVYNVLEPAPAVPSEIGTFRAIVVQNRQLMENSATYESWDSEIERLMGLADSSIRYDTPTLVAFGEYVGLQTAFIGSRGRLARAASTESAALGSLYLTYGRQMAVYEQCYPGIAKPNALELAVTDTMWRAFYHAFSRMAREYGVYLTAATLAPEIQVSTEPRDIRLFGDPDLEGQSQVYLPVGSAVYNTAVLFDPDGEIVGVTRKVNLTVGEREGATTLNLTAGRLEDVQAFQTPMGRVGIAICWDAFFDSYISHLDGLGASVVVQPSYNDGMWSVDNGGLWQPDDWLGSTLGAIQWQYPNLRYNLNTMVTGNFFDLPVDGQSAITRKADASPVTGYVANDPAYLSRYKGEFVALAPWVMEDPGIQEPGLTLAERRERLEQRSLELRAGSGSPYENDYVEAVIVADLAIVP